MSGIDGFSKIVFEISQMLSRQDLGAITYLYKLPDSSACQLEVLKELERRGLFSASSPEGLKTLLDAIYRSDLSAMVHKYMTMNNDRGCVCRHITAMMKKCNLELCVAQTDNLMRHLQDIKQRLVAHSTTHRMTPDDFQFYSEMDKTLTQMQSEVSRYMKDPLEDLQRSLGLCLHSLPSLYKELTVKDHRPSPSPSPAQMDLMHKLEARNTNISNAQVKSQPPAKIFPPNGVSKTCTAELPAAHLAELPSQSDSGNNKGMSLEMGSEGDYDFLEPGKSVGVSGARNSTKTKTRCMLHVNSSETSHSHIVSKYANADREKLNHTLLETSGSRLCTEMSDPKQTCNGEVSSASFPSPTFRAAWNRDSTTQLRSLSGSPSRQYSSSTSGPPTQTTRSSHHGSVNSDYLDYSLTCSGDDSGFEDIRELHRQLHRQLDTVSNKGSGSPGHTCQPLVQELPVYAPLDVARTDAYNDYVVPQPK